MTVYVSSMTTWWNVEESGINGWYYWKDSSLDNRYCNWYSCDRFNWYFLLWFIFRIGFIPVVIGWTEFSKWKRKKSTGPPLVKERGSLVDFLIIIIFFICINDKNGELFSMFQKTLFHFFSDDIFEKWTSLIDSKHLFLDNICRYFQSEKVKIRKTKVKERRNHLISFFWAAQYPI